jgi:hypothetical protein
MVSKLTPQEYPSWQYYPSSGRPPEWVHELISVVREMQPQIDSQRVNELTSNKVLVHLASGLKGLGYTVETGKGGGQKIRRPVLFGLNGRELIAYEIDAIHDTQGIVIEIEAGRGARGNAVYRDLIRSSLIVGAKYLALGVMLEYRHKTKGKDTRVKSFDEARGQLNAIYASGRLRLPLDGLLLFGY